MAESRLSDDGGASCLSEFLVDAGPDWREQKRARVEGSKGDSHETLITIKLPDSTQVKVSEQALRNRLAASSPLLIQLQQSLEEVGAMYVGKSVSDRKCILDLNLPPHFLSGGATAVATRILLEHLGRNDDDHRVMASLDAALSIPLVLHMYLIADWLLVVQIDRLTGWLCAAWLRDANAVVQEASSVDVNILRAAARLNLFARSSISETRFCEIADKRAREAAHKVQNLNKEIDALNVLTDVMVAEGANLREDVAPQEHFLVFIRFQGRSLVMRDCDQTTCGQHVKDWMAERVGVPERCQRLEFDGKSFHDDVSLVSIGVRRDSTLKLALRASPFTALGGLVYVKTLAGLTIEIDARPTDTIFELKVKIATELKLNRRAYLPLGMIPPGQQRLIFARRELLDDSIVSHMSIMDKSTLYLIQRLRNPDEEDDEEDEEEEMEEDEDEDEEMDEQEE